MDPNSTKSIFEFLLELSQESANELINLYDSNNQKGKTSFRFAKKRDSSLRISEQEFRFVMTCLAEKWFPSEITFSVEQPTEEDYSFSGLKAQNAWTDLSFFYNEKQALNIEFKARQPEQSVIDKDIEKLCREPIHGAWCHIFKNENEGTVKTLFNKFKKSIPKYLISDKTKPISFHILILESKTLLSRKGKCDDWERLNIDEIFNIKYNDWKNLEPGKHQFWKGQLIDINSTNPNHDWQVDKY